MPILRRAGVEQILPQSFILGIIATLSRLEQTEADVGHKTSASEPNYKIY